LGAWRTSSSRAHWVVWASLTLSMSAHVLGLGLGLGTVRAIDSTPTSTALSVSPPSVGPRATVTFDVEVSPAPAEAASVRLTVTKGAWTGIEVLVNLDGAGHGSAEIDTTNWKTGTWNGVAAFLGTDTAAPSTSTTATFTITAPDDPPPAVIDASSMDAGHSATCATTATGELSCWGTAAAGQAFVPDGDFIDVALATYHTCALASDGIPTCWGEGVILPLDPPDGTFLEIGAGQYHTCGIRTDHTLACWAQPWYTEILDPPSGAFHGLSSGGGTSCALDASNAVQCWGDPFLTSPPAGATYAQVAVGGSFACGLRLDSKVTCWGSAVDPSDASFTAIDAGGAWWCGLKTDGSIHCASNPDLGPPQSVAGTFDALAVGEFHVCARHVSGPIGCWGAPREPDWGIRPSITSAEPASATVGLTYGHQFQSSGVWPAPSFTILSGALPSGLSLDADGTISGVPDQAGASGPIVVGASNGIAPAAEQTVEIQVDPAPPVSNAGPVVIDGGADRTSAAQVTVATPATDAVAVRLSNDGTTWSTLAYAASVSWSLTNPSAGGVPSDGLKTVFVAWQDVAGTWTPASSDTIVLDRQPPSGSISIGNGSATTTTTTVIVDVPASDTSSTVSHVALSNDGATWSTRPYSASLGWTIGETNGTRTVWAKWQDATGNWSAPATDTIVLDTQPPTGSITVAGGATTTSTAVTVNLDAVDPTSGLSQVGLSNDGVSWSITPYAPATSWALPDANGSHAVWAKFRDAAGNWSTPTSDGIVLDTASPTATVPSRAFVAGSSLSGGKPVLKFAWSGSDATSGVDRYEGALSTDGGAYTTIGPSLTTPGFTRALASGHAYRLRVRAIDEAGNIGAWAYGTSFRLTTYQESSRSIRWSGTWRTGTSATFWGGQDRYATAAGAKGSLTFSGRSFAWIGSVGPSRGWARVYVNGGLVKSVNLSAATNAHRRILFATSWSTAASRTVTIRISGTAGHPRGDIDAFIVGS
jgi:hypothetical protein